MKTTDHKIFFSAGRHLLILILLIPALASAQKTREWLTAKRKFVAWPIGWIAPETGLAGGAAMTLNLRLSERDSLSPVSQISAGVVLTTKSQAVFSLPFALYMRGRKHTVTGEFSYNDFTYDYYGTGPGNFSGEKESYSTTYTLFRMNYLYRFSRVIFGGLRWWYQNDRMHAFSRNTELDTSVTGRAGGRSSGPGLVFLFDSRDNIYYPSTGWYAECTGMIQNDRTGSDFEMQRLRLDLRNFYGIGSEVFASQIFLDRVSGDPSFTQMPGIGFGSGKRGRGYYEGRYRDKCLLLLQAEWRHRFHQRWAASVFGNYAFLADDYSSLSTRNSHAAAGLGLRYFFDTENRTTVRLDLAWPIADGSQLYTPATTMKFYLSVNEAF